MKHKGMHLPDRVEELLVDQATEGLSDAQQLELDSLLDKEMAALQEEFMQTAALVQLGMLARESTSESTRVAADESRTENGMPNSLRDKIAQQAASKIAITAAGPETSSTDKDDQATVTPIGAANKRVRSRMSNLGAMSGWALAAAIAMVFFVVRPDGPVDTSLNDQRMALIESGGEVVTIPWAPSSQADFEQVSGDVVWSDSDQRGFLKLAGMPANDPQQAQYQLWIVDPERGEQPVDGGVFDIPAGSGSVIIPIDAKLTVENPTVFAITLEQPGGVVVSKGPLLVVAPVSS